MRESAFYQEIEAEAQARGEAIGMAKGQARGEARGRAEGKVEGERYLILRQLSRKIGPMPISLQTRIEALSLEQIEALGEALLAFDTQTDLIHWLDQH